MEKLLSKFLVGVVAAGSCLGVAHGPAVAETTLKFIHGFPKVSFFNRPSERFIDEVNAKGKGVVQIRLIGGPEVTPLSEQIGSVKLGINHMWYGTVSAFQSQIEESRALVLSDYTAPELRAKGAPKLLEPYYNRIGLHSLAYFGSGYTFYVYLNKKPKRLANGGVDLTGFRLRAPAIYRPIMKFLKATPVNVEVAELYEALERGRVDGFAWLDIGMSNFSWQKHIKYRITPNFWQGDVSILVQLKAWRGLSREARDLLTGIGHKYEAIAHDFMIGLKNVETEKLRDVGVQDIEITGGQRQPYLDSAHEALWQIIEDKSGKAVRDKLEAAFTKRD